MHHTPLSAAISVRSSSDYWIQRSEHGWKTAMTKKHVLIRLTTGMRAKQQKSIQKRRQIWIQSESFVVSCGCWPPGLSQGGDSDAICSETPHTFGRSFWHFFGIFSKQFSMHFCGALIFRLLGDKGAQMGPKSRGSRWKCG